MEARRLQENESAAKKLQKAARETIRAQKLVAAAMERGEAGPSSALAVLAKKTRPVTKKKVTEAKKKTAVVKKKVSLAEKNGPVTKKGTTATRKSMRRQNIQELEATFTSESEGELFCCVCGKILVAHNAPHDKVCDACRNIDFESSLDGYGQS